MKGLRSTLCSASHSDDGMTLIEIVVAAVILFIGITAVFSLLITSTSMSVMAKQQNIAINAANSYMEYVRSLPYEQVGVPGQSVEGSLTAEVTSTVNGFAVSIMPTVTWVNDPNILGPQDYKKVVVAAAVTAPNEGKTITRTFSTYVRKNTDVQIPPDWVPPTITFVAGFSPVDGSPVFGNAVHVRVTATSPMTDGTIQDVSIRCDTGLLVGTGTDSVTSAHWGGLATKTKTFDFYWDTEYVFEGGVTLQDGPHWLVADVVDSIGQTSETRINVVIDNKPPTGLSSAPTVVSTSDVASTLSWGKAWDPEGPVDVGADCWGYALSLRKQPPGGAASYADWSEIASPTAVGQLTYSAVTTGLSRYWCSVTPVSPRLLPGPAEEVVWVSPPLASGTYADAEHGNDHTISNTITLSSPTFQNSARAYTLYRSTSSTGPWTDPVDTNSTLSATQVYAYTDKLDENSTQRYYYRVKVVITPAGAGDLTPVTTWSNVIGPNPTSGSGSLPSVGW